MNSESLAPENRSKISAPDRIIDQIDLAKPKLAHAAPIESKLELAEKLFQKSIVASALKVAQGQRLDAPLVVDLDPTTFCDLACPECISSGVLNKGQFSALRIERLAEELVEAGVKGVILIGGGEPLMHRSIGKIITTLSDGGVKVGMVTNGTLIDRHIEILAERMSWIRVSMDAASPEIYDRFRPSGRKVSVFPKVIENITNLAKVKKGRLGYSFLLMQRRDENNVIYETNYDQVLKAGQLAKSIGCDYLEVKAVFDDGHFVIEEAAADIQKVQDQLDALAKIEDESFRVLRSSTWTALKTGADREQPKNYNSCHIAELRATITPSGVYSCAYHRGSEKGLIGDVTDTSLRSMWKDAVTRKLDPAKDCRFHCARHSSNLTIAKMSEGLKSEVRDDYDFFI
ncbi:MAG: radical SAM protein [Sphingomonadales bacterium]|nr:radical SAM protein [Sphingomonadales bacterium]